MFRNLDFRQVRALTRFTLLSEWRQASSRSIGRKRKMSRGWAYGTIVAYLVTGIILVRIFKGNMTGAPYVTAVSLEMLFLGFITASNIFLSFGTGFLSPDEVQIVSPLPVSSEVFFLSRLTVLLSYTWIVTLLFITGAMIALPVFFGASFLQMLMLFVVAFLSNTAAAMAVIVLYGLILKELPKQALSKVLGYVQFAGSFTTAFSFVILPRIERNLDLHEWTLEAKPLLALIPAFWYGSLAGLATMATSSLNVALAAVSIMFLAALAWSSHVLLGKNYATEVGDLRLSSAALTKQAKQRRQSLLFRLFMRFARSHEARAVFMLMRAQFRFDAKFRMSLLATLPVTVLYLLLAILQGGIGDPFTGNFRSIINSQFLYIFAMVMPLMVMQAVLQSENYKAAWVFFASPLDRSKLLFAVRNTLVISIIIPYMVLLATIFSFFIPVGHAIAHILVLAAMGAFIFQAYLMVNPKMPFAQQRRPNRTSVAVIIGVAFFAGAAVFLLGLEIYYGYRTPVSFWTSLALIVTLSILLNQVVRSRVRKKLELEEFEG
jgi:ABC-2 type transport system permease protein